MAFTLPDLPYDYAELAPTIDEQTMRLHRLLVDVRLQPVVGVGQRRHLVGHTALLVGRSVGGCLTGLRFVEYKQISFSHTELKHGSAVEGRHLK